jgi:uncharacterized protein (DUF2141 family)
LKADTLNFTTKKLSDYGRLTVRIRGLDTAQNAVLLFVQGSQVAFSAPLRNGIYRSTLFSPGEYELRILYDDNGNGRWDPGQFLPARRQPEKVVPVTQGINVKADWDNDFERSL